MSETTIRPLPGSWTERIIVRGEARYQKVERGEIKPEARPKTEEREITTINLGLSGQYDCGGE